MAESIWASTWLEMLTTFPSLCLHYNIPCYIFLPDCSNSNITSYSSMCAVKIYIHMASRSHLSSKWHWVAWNCSSTNKILNLERFIGHACFKYTKQWFIYLIYPKKADAVLIVCVPTMRSTRWSAHSYSLHTYFRAYRS